MRRIWDRLFLDIDQQLQNPEQLSDNMRARIRACQAREDFTKATQYPHKVLTAHNHVITPYRIRISPRGGVSVNMPEFLSQPRMATLKAQMAPAEKGGLLLLDEASGRFYLNTDPQNPLGKIDIKTEKTLFQTAAQAARVKYLFGDASHENPVCLDMATGAVTAKDNPADVRGHVRLGRTLTLK